MKVHLIPPATKLKIIADVQSKQFLLKDVAVKYSCSCDNIRTILKQEGYTTNLWNKIEVNEPEMIELYLSGATGTELGKKYEVDSGIIYARLKKLGIKVRGRNEIRYSYRKDIDTNTVIELFNSGMLVTDIAKKFNCTHKVISKRLTDNGIEFRHSTKTLVGQDQEIIDDYLSGLGPSTIGEKYNVSNVTIFNKLKENDVIMRNSHEANMKYPYDEHFFDIIDTEAKAYFLGLLLADGYNHEKKNTVSLSLTDYDQVKQFADAVKTIRPIYKGISIMGSDGYARTNTYTLSLSGEYFSSQLANKGCMQRKTFKITFPTSDIVPDYLIHHMVRGYFDGDGCIHIRKNSENRVIHILGTEHFMKGIQNILPVKSFVKIRSGEKIFYLGMYRRADIKIFGDWLYKDAVHWMDRKRVLFE